MKKLMASLCLLAVPVLLAGRSALASGPLTIPLNPADVLGACQELRTQQPFALADAVKSVQSCVNNYYGRHRKYTVDVRQGRFAVSLTPAGNGAAHSGTAMAEVEGIIIAIKGKIMTGDAVVRDLNYSLEQRQGKLLGWYATVDDHEAKYAPY